MNSISNLSSSIVCTRKLRECEDRLQISEMNTLREENKEDPSNISDDNVLIEKLHERLLASQNQLIKVQSELQRSHIEKAATASELAECQRKISGQEVQMLMATQSHTQQQQAKEEEYRAKENSWKVQLMTANQADCWAGGAVGP